MAAMLKQRQKDIQIIEGVNAKINRLQQDRDMYEEKYKAAQHRINESDKEKY